MTKNFTLNLSENTRWIEKFEEIMGLTRKFQSISMTWNSNNPPHAMALLVQISSKHGKQIRKLALSLAEFENPKYFYKILNNMPLLAELEVNSVKLLMGDFTLETPLTMRHLTTLTVNASDWNLFSYFMASTIRNLKISNKFMYVDSQQRQTYIRFLEASDKLESMEFDLMSFAKTFHTQLNSKILFKLKRFKCLVFSPDYDTGDVYMNFATFLESQALSLKELELNYVLPSITQIIFTKLKILEKLRLNSVSLPGRNEFYNQFKTMSRLKELTLHDAITSDIAVTEILAKCPNLETLNAQHDPMMHIPNLLSFIAVHNPKIKCLSLDYLLVAVPSQFKHLKFLHIETCLNFEFLIAFLRNNASIETLSLSLVEDETVPDEPTIDALLDQPGLQNLRIRACDNTLKAIYNKVKIDYKKLKSLELTMLTRRTIDNILIKFPNDKSEWVPRNNLFDGLSQIYYE